MRAFDLLDLQLNGHYYGLVACRISLMHPLNCYKQVIHVQHADSSTTSRFSFFYRIFKEDLLCFYYMFNFL